MQVDILSSCATEVSVRGCLCDYAKRFSQGYAVAGLPLTGIRPCTTGDLLERYRWTTLRQIAPLDTCSRFGRYSMAVRRRSFVSNMQLNFTRLVREE